MANPDDIAALAAAFRKARYQVPELGDAGAFAVGAVASGVEAALPAACYAFITAWDSDSESDSRMENASADGELSARLDQLNATRFSAHAEDAQGAHREAGWLVLDLPLPELDRLARHFDQDGTLAWTLGEAVRLRMYHPCPPDAAPALWTDWVE